MIADDEEDPGALALEDTQGESEDAEFDKNLFGGAGAAPVPEAPLPVEQQPNYPSLGSLYAPADAIAAKPVPSDEELLQPQAPSSKPEIEGAVFIGKPFKFGEAGEAAPSSEPPIPGAVWIGEKFKLPVRDPFKEKPPEQRSILMEPVVGAARGVAGTAFDLVDVFNTVERKLGDWTGADFIKNLAASDQQLTDTLRKRIEPVLAPTVASLEEIVKDPSASNIARYGLGKVGEAIPMILEYVYAGVPMMIIAGVVVGADKAARDNDGDYGATLTGGAIGGVSAGAKAPLMTGAAGKGLVENIARATLGMPLITTAQALAEPLPKAVATGTYTPKTWWDIADAAVGGALGGAAVGVHGYARSRGRAPELPPVDEGTGQDPDHTAAIKEATGGPPEGTPGGPPRAVPIPPAGAPEPTQRNLPLESSPELPLRPPEAPVGRPGGVSQPELPGTRQVQPEPALPGTEEPYGPRLPLGEGVAAEAPVGRVEAPPVEEPSARGPVGAPVAKTPEGWTVHPDPSGTGHVVRNANGDAIALGDTPQQAVEFARARAVPPEVRAAMDATEPPPPPEGPRPPEPMPQPPPGGRAPEQMGLTLPEQQLPLPMRAAEAPVGRPGEAQPELPGMRPPEPIPRLPGLEEPLGPRNVAPGEGAERPIGAVERPAEEPSARGPIGPPPRQPGWTVERDHTGPGHVVKNADGNVIAVGDTPQQAMEFARARSAEQTVARAERETRKAEAEASAAREPGRLVKGKEPEPVTEKVAPAPTTVVEEPKKPPATKGEQLRAKRAAEKEKLKKPSAEKAPEVASLLRKKSFVSEGEPPPSKEELPPAKPEPRRSRMAEEARREATEQPGLFEPEGAAAEEAVEPAPKERSKKTTNLTRNAEDHLQSILEAEPGEAASEAARAAHEAYGVQKPGRGARRIYSGIADYIEARIDAALDKAGYKSKLATMLTDQAILDKARELQQRINRRDPKLTPESRAAQEREINAALERNREVREREEELRAIVKELRGGSEESKAADLDAIRERLRARTAAVARGEELESPLTLSESMAQRLMDMIRTRTETVRQLFRAPEINKPLQDLIRTDGRDGLGTSAHVYLDAIISNSMARSAIPHAVELARQLKRILPADIRVMTQETGRDLFGREMTPRAAGSYSRDLDTIFLNSRLAGDDLRRAGVHATDTLLHEGLHGGTAHYIDHLLTGEQHGTLDHIKQRHLDAFRAIDAAVRDIGINPHRMLSDLEIAKLNYANKNLHELTTLLMTDPVVHDVVRDAPASPEFRRQMNRLGYGLKPTNSVWDGFRKLMSRVLHLGPKQDSFLDHVMSPMTEIIEVAGQYRAAHEAGIRGEAEVTQARRMFARAAQDDNPLNQIQDARQREAVRPLAEHLSELDAPLAGSKVRDAADRFWINMLRKVDGAMVKRTTRQGALLASPRNSVVAHNADIFASRDADMPGAKPLENWRDADASVWRATMREQEHYADRVKNLVRRMVGPERMDIAQLMNDVGYARVHLGEKDVAADNPHIEAGTDQAKDMHRLNGVYNNLSAAGQETYRGYKQYYRETYAKERKAEFESIVKKSLPDLTPAEHTALAGQMTTLKKINDLIRAPDRTPLADAFAERWQHNRAMVREVAKAQRSGFVEGDYFPHRRYGDYVIKYGNRDSSDYGVEMFETSSAAEARRQEILDEGKVDVSPVFLKADHNAVRANIPRELIDQLDAAIKQKGLGTDQAETVRQAMLGLMLKNGTNRSAFRMRREGVKGAALEPEKTLVNDYTAYSSRMGHLLHGGERSDAMQALERHYERMRMQGDGQLTSHRQAAAAQEKLAELRQAKVAENDPRMLAQRQILNRGAPAEENARARDTIDSLKQRSAPIDGDMSADIIGRTARGFNTISAVYQLLRPAHLAIGLIDTHTKAEAYIGARHGFGAAGLALAKAVKDLAPRTAMTGGRAMYRAVMGDLKVADWDMTKLMRDRLLAANPKNKAEINQLMDAYDATGMSSHSKAREVQRMSRPGAFDFAGRSGSFISNLPGNLLNMMSVAEHTMDTMNRTAVVKAAFDLEMRKTSRDVNRSIEYALEEGRKAMPDYTPGNKPPLAQSQVMGRLAAPAMLYKLYGMHTYSVMANLVKQASTGAERAEARKALAATLAFHSMLIGVLPSLFGVPVNAVLGAYDMFTGKDEPHDYETDMRNAVSDLLGPTAAALASRGVIGAAGADLHRSLKLSNMTDITGPKSFDAKGWGGAVLTAMTGASGSQAYQFADAFHNLFSGNFGKAVTQFLPRIARDAVQGYQVATEGIKDTRGVTLIKPQNISPVDIGLKVLGFTPQSWATPQDKRAKLAEFERELHADRTHAEQAYTRAYQANDMSTAFKVLKSYNDMHPNARITSAQMANRMKDIAKRSNDPRFGGLAIPQKQQAEALRTVRGFAQ